MTATSPRLDRRLRAAVRHLDDPREPVAETWRKVGALALGLDLPRPSYDTVRLIVRAHRRSQNEVRELLQPVLSDFVQGRLSTWDVERIIDAARTISR